MCGNVNKSSALSLGFVEVNALEYYLYCAWVKTSTFAIVTSQVIFWLTNDNQNFIKLREKRWENIQT